MNMTQLASRYDAAWQQETAPLRGSDRPGNISAVEQRILRQLVANARITNAELAEKVGLSPSPCWRKVRALEERGVIARYSAILDPVALGLSVEATIDVGLDRHAAADRARFEAQVLSRPEVAELHAVSGEADYQMRVHVRDTQALGRFIDFVAAVPCVRSLKSHILLSTVRRASAFGLQGPDPV